jgi:hypothetical protein
MSELTQQLVLNLQASLSPDSAAIQASTEFIKQAKKVDGYARSMLEISAEQSVDINVRLAAAVQLGVHVEFNWKFQDPEQAQRIAF